METTPKTIGAALPASTAVESHTSPTPTLVSNGKFAPDDSDPAKPPPFRPTRRFYLIFLSICVSCFLSALDLAAVSVTLPSIAADLNSDSDYSWVGSAYALTSTAFIPWFGGFATIFGRRPTMLAALVFFAVGSAISGSAPTMNVLIVGRSIQGVGGGGIMTMGEILVVDLVPLAQRGLYGSIVGSIFAIASAIGPPIGGAFGESKGLWRWLFYMNLPIAGVAIVFVAIFLSVKVPPTDMREKIAQMDYVNVLFVSGTTAATLGLTFAGSTYSWGSYHVLVPLILGLVGMLVYFFIEKNYVRYPTVPFDMFRDRSALVGFVNAWVHGLVSMATIYYLPVYFQAGKSTSALQSGIDLFTLCFTISPFAIMTGIAVTITGRYLIPNYGGWVVSAIAFGLCTLLTPDSSVGHWVGYPLLLGIGLGLLYGGLGFPVLAPLKVERQPHAMAFITFTRSFGQVFGIAIGATVLNSQLAKTLPSEYLDLYGVSAQTAYASITQIKDLAEPLQHEVKVAFVKSLSTVWQVMIGFSVFGFLATFAMRQHKLTSETDENWGLKEKGAAKEKAGMAAAVALV